MLKKILLVIFLQCALQPSVFAEPDLITLYINSKTVIWQQTPLLIPDDGKIKIDKPIYIGEKFYYSGWSKGQWLVTDGNRVILSALDDKVRISTSNPQYFCYWTKAGNGKKLVLHDAEGKMIPLPGNAAYTDVVQRRNDTGDGFTGEVYFQYWIDDEPGYRNGKGTLIETDGKVLLPLDNYKFTSYYGILGDGWFNIRKGDKNVLFKDRQVKLTADRITQAFKGNYDLWRIENRGLNSFINLKTGKQTSQPVKLLYQANLEVLLSNCVKVDMPVGTNHGELKFFQLKDVELIDITPSKNKVIFASYIKVPKNEIIAQKFLVFEEGEQYGKIYTFLKNGKWDKDVEQTTLTLPEEKQIYLYCQWDTLKNYYPFFGYAYDPTSHSVSFPYFSQNKNSATGKVIKMRAAGKIFDEEVVEALRKFNKKLYADKKYWRLEELIALDEKDHSVILQKSGLEDGFVDSMETVEQYFYKENDEWFVYEQKEKQAYHLAGIKNLSTVKNTGLALYEADNETGVFLLASKEKLILPKGLDIISMIYGSANDRYVNLHLRENANEKIIKFSWSGS